MPHLESTDIVFIIGLTGVGKSSSLAALAQSGADFHLLPNRRQLTDDIIIPAMLSYLGKPIKPVLDRVMRFELTRLYKEQHPGGMAEVVASYLRQHHIPSDVLVFDNLRGQNELAYAAQAFPKARFVMFDAAEDIRLQRILGREAVFDQTTSFQLSSLSQLPDIPNTSPEEIAKALKIIESEKQNYNVEETRDFIFEAIAPERRLYINTGDKPLEQVVRKLSLWFQQYIPLAPQNSSPSSLHC